MNYWKINNMNDMNESWRCFAIIALTTTVIVILDLSARAFFYAQAQHITPFLPLLIGCISLCVMGITRKNRNEPKESMDQPNTAGIRRVRVTGPVK